MNVTQDDRTRLFGQGALDLEPRGLTPWHHLGIEDQAQVRAEVLAACEKYRQADDASAEKLADAMLQEQRVIVRFSPNGAMEVFFVGDYCRPGDRPSIHLQGELNTWLQPVRAVHPLADGIAHYLAADGARALLRERHRQVAADLAQAKKESDEAAERSRKRQEVQAEKRERNRKWCSLPPTVRALLRGHSDKKTHEIMLAIASAILNEPEQIKRSTEEQHGEMPPRCAWSILGIEPHPLIPEEK